MYSATKTCSSCEAIKPLADFHKKKASKDGHRTICKSCKAVAAKQYNCENKESESERSKKYHLANKGRIAERKKQYREDNKAKIAKNKKHYRAANKISISEYFKTYRTNNKHKINARNAKRRAIKLQATPKWYECKQVIELYEQAKDLRTSGVDVHVDHIVPLVGAIVCGLHCFANLQLLSAQENMSKGNKHAI